jgi:hypothetical protein
VRDEIVPGADWVVAGEGVGTRKFDGTCCKVSDGVLWKRYDAKKGKTPPVGWVMAQDKPDAVTGHCPGWVMVGDKPEDQWHVQAWKNQFGPDGKLPDGTYELCGPKVQKDAERAYRMSQQSDETMHILIPHGCYVFGDAPRTFNALKEWFAGKDIEGIVWHHEDGRMVKIKLRDFGLQRKREE